ncbi:hypothetical protein NUW58_g7587 [Xylaria curta]|uniref:Uncharacterized protein n=1 Tax=Xylaria curta TaxID=42375 RepID=A0ACC1NH58_9PEZI|nr:hypothetical protein NUW58_g7587 [Xylaria curta]
MIQLKTMLNCIDNSGAAVVECALVVGQKRHATIGDRFVAIVQKQRNASDAGMGAASAANKVKRGDIRHAIVVRTKKKVQRPDGSVVRFDDNACVLVNKSGRPHRHACQRRRRRRAAEAEMEQDPEYGAHSCLDAPPYSTRL